MLTTLDPEVSSRTETSSADNNVSSEPAENAVATATQPTKSSPPFALLVVRDAALNIVFTFVAGAVAGFFFTLQQVQSGHIPTEAETAGTRYGAAIVGGIASTIAYVISGCLGREYIYDRARRLWIVAGIMWSINVLVALTGSIPSENPMAAKVGAVIGCTIGELLRVWIGRLVSMTIAPPAFQKITDEK